MPLSSWDTSLVPGEKVDMDRFNWINDQSLFNKDLVNFNIKVLET